MTTAETREALAARLATMTPSEVDMEWAERVLVEVNRKRGDLAAAEANFKRYVRYYGHEECTTGRRKHVGEAVERAKAKLAEVEALSEPYEAEWERRPWERYWLVVSSAHGHVHRYHCGTLRPGRTQVTPWWQVSGKTEAEVVEDLTYTACTHCFRSAPVRTMPTPAEEGYCAGSRKPIAPGSWRQTSYTGNGHGRCAVCGESVGAGKHGVARKHRAKGGER
jgi:hypothetical protein